MKIDFKKLKKVEAEYRNDRIALNTLQTMVNILLKDERVSEASKQIAQETLAELNILIDTSPAKKLTHLNS